MIAAEYYNNNMVNNVILVTGEDFPDALSASVLAHKLDAPILLVDSTISDSSNAFDYIFKHLDKSEKYDISWFSNDYWRITHAQGNFYAGLEVVKYKDFPYFNAEMLKLLQKYQ